MLPKITSHILKSRKPPNTSVVHLDLCHGKALSAVMEVPNTVSAQYGSHQPHVATLNVASLEKKSNLYCHVNQCKFK